MEIHLYKLDDTAFRVLILFKGRTVHRGLFDAQNYNEASRVVADLIQRLELAGQLTEEI